MSTRTIGVLGAGEVGQAIAGQAIRHGHEVLIGNRRGPQTLEALADRLGPKAHAVTAEEATKPELVFLNGTASRRARSVGARVTTCAERTTPRVPRDAPPYG
jgi:predicted dinucleotide-binding enzyme